MTNLPSPYQRFDNPWHCRVAELAMPLCLSAKGPASAMVPGDSAWGGEGAGWVVRAVWGGGSGPSLDGVPEEEGQDRLAYYRVRMDHGLRTTRVKNSRTSSSPVLVH